MLHCLSSTHRHLITSASVKSSLLSSLTAKAFIFRPLSERPHFFHCRPFSYTSTQLQLQAKPKCIFRGNSHSRPLEVVTAKRTSLLHIFSPLIHLPVHQQEFSKLNSELLCRNMSSSAVAMEEDDCRSSSSSMNLSIPVTSRKDALVLTELEV